MDKEIWVKIPSFENYEASNLGNIRTHNWKNSGQTRVLKPAKCAKGYLKTVLSGKGIKVHRIIAKTFIPNPDNKPQINHINGIKDDNRAENLEWVTNRENVIHSYKLGLQVPKSGNDFHRTKHSDELVLEIHEAWKKGASKRALARLYKVDRNIFKRKILCQS